MSERAWRTSISTVDADGNKDSNRERESHDSQS